MKKILLVDDLRTIVEKEKSILSRADFALFTATSGREALEIHRKEKVDLIVTDLDMPGMGGDELCLQIRNDGDLKKVSIIIACTNRKEDLSRCQSCGANSYVTKPIEPQKFFEKVSQFLNVSERKSYRVLVKAKIEGRFMDVPFFCTSKDISTTGLMVECEKALSKGDIIACSFYLPDADHIVTNCEVVRSIPSGSQTAYGLKFIGLSTANARAIEAFIARSR